MWGRCRLDQTHLLNLRLSFVPFRNREAYSHLPHVRTDPFLEIAPPSKDPSPWDPQSKPPDLYPIVSFFPQNRQRHAARFNTRLALLPADHIIIFSDDSCLGSKQGEAGSSVSRTSARFPDCNILLPSAICRGPKCRNPGLPRRHLHAQGFTTSSLRLRGSHLPK